MLTTGREGSDGASPTSRRPEGDPARLVVLVTLCLMLSGALLLGAPDADGAATCDTTYTDGAPDDSFYSAANWSNGFPDTTKHGCIEGAFTVRHPGATAQIAGLTIDHPDAVLIAEGGIRLSSAGAATADPDFSNLGTVELAGGSIDMSVGTEFVNQGHLVVSATGFIQNGTVTNGVSGEIDVASGESLQLFGASQTFVNEGLVSVEGQLTPFSIDSFVLEGGSTISGAGSVRITGSNQTDMEWRGGTIDVVGDFVFNRPNVLTLTGLGSGGLTVEAPGGRLQGPVGPDQVIDLRGQMSLSGDLLNEGRIVFGASGNLLSGGFDVTNAGTMEIAATFNSVDGPGAFVQAPGSELVVNAGSEFFVRPTRFEFAQGSLVTGAGTVELHAQQIDLDGGTLDVAEFVIDRGDIVSSGDAAGTLVVERGNTFNPTFAGTIGPQFTLHVRRSNLSGGLDLAADVLNQGTLILDSPGAGQALGLSGPFVLTNEGAVAIIGAGQAQTSVDRFVNGTSGIVAVDELATLRTANGTEFVNDGTLVLEGQFDSFGTIATSGSALGGGELELSGAGSELAGTGDFLTNVVTTVSRLVPGASPGVLELASLDLDFSSTTEIEIGGTTPGDHDQIRVTGAADIAGTLSVSLVNGFQPELCDSFDIVTGAPVTGNFFFTPLNVGNGLRLVPFVRPDRFTLVASQTNSAISIAPTAVGVAEGGATDTYELCLGSDPFNPVVVSAEDPSGEVTTSPEPITFQPGGELVQTVTVTAVDDLRVEADPHQATISSTVVSGDANFLNANLPDVVATIADDDVPAPIAVDDVTVVAEDDAVGVDVLANDDPNGTVIDVASLAVVAAPADGAADVDTVTGLITYTPGLNFHGFDSFTYTVDDTDGFTSNDGIVNITVTPVNDAPVANPDESSTLDDRSAVVIDVVLNDGDVDGDVLSIAAVDPKSAEGGAAAVTLDGRVRYTPPGATTSSADAAPASTTSTTRPSATTSTSGPDVTPASVDSSTVAEPEAVPAFVGVDTFTYTVTDGNGAFDQATVRVDVGAGAPLPPTPPTTVPAVPIGGSGGGAAPGQIITTTTTVPSTTTTATTRPPVAPTVTTTPAPSTDVTTAAPIIVDEAELAGPVIPPDDVDDEPRREDAVAVTPRGEQVELTGDAEGCESVAVVDPDGQVLAVADVVDDRFEVGVPTLELELGIVELRVLCAGADGAANGGGELLLSAPIGVSQPASGGPGPGRPGMMVIIVILVMVGVSQFLGSPPAPAELDILFQDPDQMTGGQLQAYREAQFD